jgi:hypothetical protein
MLFLAAGSMSWTWKACGAWILRNLAALMNFKEDVSVSLRKVGSARINCMAASRLGE